MILHVQLITLNFQLVLQAFYDERLYLYQCSVTNGL